MRSNEQIRPLTDVPDHGHGPLGGLAHSVLTEYTGAVLSAPRLHLGQNTLPNPPLPLATQVPFGDLTEGWLECGKDLIQFLATGARALRCQPIPDISVYSQHVRILQRVLRFDSIALVCAEEMIKSADTVADFVPAAGQPTRRYSRARRAGEFTALTVVAVDRAGTALLGWVKPAGEKADIEVIGDVVTADDQIVALLRDVLVAQYDWTSAVFGVVP